MLSCRVKVHIKTLRTELDMRALLGCISCGRFSCEGNCLDAGVPTVVARRSLPDDANLVGRRVTSGPEALQAATDGASLVILEVRAGAPLCKHYMHAALQLVHETLHSRLRNCQ